MTFIKDVSGNADAGTASKWGGNNIMTLDGFLDDIDISGSIINGTGAARINTPTRFRSTKLILRDSGNDHNYIFVTSDLAANRNVTMPLLTADDTFVFINFAQTLSSKTLDSPIVTSFAEFDDTTTPANPSAGFGRVFLDSADGILKIKKSSGSVVNLEPTADAPTGAQYITLATDATLTAERVFTAGENVKTTDGGANGNLTVDVLKEAYVRSGVISPTQISADTNDWNPTNLQTNSILRVDCDSSFRKLTGITAPSPDNSRIITLRNISANTLLLCDQNAGSSAANRFDFQGYDLPLFPKKEITLRYDMTLDRWVCENLFAHVIPQIRYGFYYRNDMFGTAADSVVSSQVQGTGAANDVAAITSVAGHPGVVQHQSGTTSSGSAAMGTTNQATILLGQNWYWRYEAMFRIPTLSDGTNRFGIEQGFLDGMPSAAPNDGVYLYTIDNINSGKWRLVAVNNATQTTADDTGTAVAAATWYRAVVKVFPSGTEARAFVNGTEISASLSSGLPTGAGRGTGFGSYLFKTLGSTSRTIDLDYIEVIGYANTVS